MDNILILGAGQFGRNAAAILKASGADITVADQSMAALKPLEKAGYNLICGEATVLLNTFLSPDRFNYIVPAVPIHVAFSWLVTKLRQTGLKCRPIPVPTGLPVHNPLYLDGTLYASFASHRCPGDCPEPEGYCLVTGEERESPLYQLLLALRVEGFTIKVIKSHQLAPGVGGITGADLTRLFREVRGSGQDVILATSCSCHAVLSALTCK